MASYNMYDEIKSKYAAKDDKWETTVITVVIKKQLGFHNTVVSGIERTLNNDPPPVFPSMPC